MSKVHSQTTTGRLAKVAGLAAVGAAVIMFAVSPDAMALTRVTIYDNLPAHPFPGNVASLAFESNSVSEFGGQVQFDGIARHNPQVTFVLSSWACESGSASTGDCSTAKGAMFTHPINVNIYAVGAGNEPGTLLGRVKHTFKIPYRPSANYTQCTGMDAGKWYSKRDGKCYNGRSVKRRVSLGSLDLPDTVIIGIAYNTTHYGYNPIGEGASCYGTSGGCPYDSLNVGTGDSPAIIGSQPLPDDAYLNSSSGGAYCDGGASGTGTFRLDAGCWTGYQPAFRVKGT